MAITHAGFTMASLAMTLFLGRPRASNEFANPAFGAERIDMAEAINGLIAAALRFPTL